MAEKLCAITDEHGRVMHTKVLRPQDIYTGPYLPYAPDLLVYFDDLYWRCSQDIGHDALHSFETEIGPDDAVHDYDGVFVLYNPSPGAAQGYHSGMRMLDGAPTLLHLLDLDVPADMEGNIIG